MKNTDKLPGESWVSWSERMTRAGHVGKYRYAEEPKKVRSFRHMSPQHIHDTVDIVVRGFPKTKAVGEYTSSMSSAMCVKEEGL